MTNITELAQLRAELSNPAIGSKDHLRKLALSLVEALEKAQKSNEFLKGQLSELANFNPDWDKLEASYDSWREIAAELLVAKERIAELESRTITVKRSKRSVGEVMHMSGFSRDYAEGWCAGNDDAIHQICNTPGIKWEAE
ncbi:ead/Ea22-like family protein [Klebsiella oxytoca]|uniref:ead/Ea22-like family protein n=1 Tax=Klebsiella oxytoca TaxID=571 RepID=UPI00265FBFF4|nr:ead/Ea22-like family protein [Klebsiella oxytoca]WKM78472.1 ead/Ea22-like family protein [Klebsiella oxytoca]